MAKRCEINHIPFQWDFYSRGKLTPCIQSLIFSNDGARESTGDPEKEFGFTRPVTAMLFWWIVDCVQYSYNESIIQEEGLHPVSLICIRGFMFSENVNPEKISRPSKEIGFTRSGAGIDNITWWRWENSSNTVIMGIFFKSCLTREPC